MGMYIRRKLDWQGRLVEEVVGRGANVIVMPVRTHTARRKRMKCKVLEFRDARKTKQSL